MRRSRCRGLCIAQDLFVLTMGAAILAAILVPNFIRAREQGMLTACKSNLKNLASACELWSLDHDGHYPPSLDVLEDKFFPRAGLPQCPDCDKGYRYRLVAVDLEGGTESGYDILCPDGRAHGLPEDEPHYTAREGLFCQDADFSKAGGFQRAGQAFSYGVVMLLSFALLCASLAQRPEPTGAIKAFLERSPMWSRLSTASWFLLVTGVAAMLYVVCSPWLGLVLSLLLASWLCGPLASGVVRLGYRFWGAIGPAEAKESSSLSTAERPVLGLSGRRDVLLPRGNRRRLEILIRVGLPLSVVTALVLGPALVPDTEGAMRGALFGLAASALLSWPLYLWGKTWARTLIRRELEWVPGSDQLLEHRLDGTRVRLLGTLAEVERVHRNQSGYKLLLRGESFQLPAGELGRELAAAVAS